MKPQTEALIKAAREQLHIELSKENLNKLSDQCEAATTYIIRRPDYLEDLQKFISSLTKKEPFILEINEINKLLNLLVCFFGETSIKQFDLFYKNEIKIDKSFSPIIVALANIRFYSIGRNFERYCSIPLYRETFFYIFYHFLIQKDKKLYKPLFESLKNIRHFGYVSGSQDNKPLYTENEDVLVLLLTKWSEKGSLPAYIFEILSAMSGGSINDCRTFSIYNLLEKMLNSSITQDHVLNDPTPSDSLLLQRIRVLRKHTSSTNGRLHWTYRFYEILANEQNDDLLQCHINFFFSLVNENLVYKNSNLHYSFIDRYIEIYNKNKNAELLKNITSLIPHFSQNNILKADDLIYAFDNLSHPDLISSLISIRKLDGIILFNRSIIDLTSDGVDKIIALGKKITELGFDKSWNTLAGRVNILKGVDQAQLSATIQDFHRFLLEENFTLKYYIKNHKNWGPIQGAINKELLAADRITLVSFLTLIKYINKVNEAQWGNLYATLIMLIHRIEKLGIYLRRENTPDNFFDILLTMDGEKILALIEQLLSRNSVIKQKIEKYFVYLMMFLPNECTQDQVTNLVSILEKLEEQGQLQIYLQSLMKQETPTENLNAFLDIFPDVNSVDTLLSHHQFIANNLAHWSNIAEVCKKYRALAPHALAFVNADGAYKKNNEYLCINLFELNEQIQTKKVSEKDYISLCGFLSNLGSPSSNIREKNEIKPESFYKIKFAVNNIQEKFTFHSDLADPKLYFHKNFLFLLSEHFTRKINDISKEDPQALVKILVLLQTVRKSNASNLDGISHECVEVLHKINSSYNLESYNSEYAALPSYEGEAPSSAAVSSVSSVQGYVPVATSNTVLPSAPLLPSPPIQVPTHSRIADDSAASSSDAALYSQQPSADLSDRKQFWATEYNGDTILSNSAVPFSPKPLPAVTPSASLRDYNVPIKIMKALRAFNDKLTYEDGEDKEEALQQFISDHHTTFSHPNMQAHLIKTLGDFIVRADSVCFANGNLLTPELYYHQNFIHLLNPNGLLKLQGILESDAKLDTKRLRVQTELFNISTAKPEALTNAPSPQQTAAHPTV